jgi:probable rRNA maturation factor
LIVTVQIATSRKGVPHPRTLSDWAKIAYDDGRERAAKFLKRARQTAPASLSLTIRVVGRAESRALNRTWRGKDRPTNVLSFPGLGADPAPVVEDTLPLGDLAICAPIVAREAREQDKTPQAHWAHMVVHGVLHLLGYDHEHDREADVMEGAETQILARCGFANPYLSLR